MDPHKLTVRDPDLTATADPVYANVVHISFTPYDFRVTFSLMSTPLDGSEPGSLVGPFVPRGVAEIVMPAAAVEAFADLLRSELRQFVERFGEPQPRPSRASA